MVSHFVVMSARDIEFVTPRHNFGRGEPASGPPNLIRSDMGPLGGERRPEPEGIRNIFVKHPR